MPSPFDPAALTALGRDRVATDVAHCPVVSSRRCILVRFNCDGQGRGRWTASLKASPSERARTLSVPAHEGPDAAVAALLAREGLDWLALPAVGSIDGGETYAYTMELRPAEGIGLAHGELAALAILAARELTAALAGAGDAEPLALPLALARMATGAAPIRPVVDGFIMGDRLTLTDALGRPIPGLVFPGPFSPAGALAAAKAAGWLLTAPMAATAARHTDALGLSVDPDALALAVAARGGCPAIVAALSTKGAA